MKAVKYATLKRHRIEAIFKKKTEKGPPVKLRQFSSICFLQKLNRIESILLHGLNTAGAVFVIVQAEFGLFAALARVGDDVHAHGLTSQHIARSRPMDPPPLTPLLVEQLTAGTRARGG